MPGKSCLEFWYNFNKWLLCGNRSCDEVFFCRVWRLVCGGQNNKRELLMTAVRRVALTLLLRWDLEGILFYRVPYIIPGMKYLHAMSYLLCMRKSALRYIYFRIICMEVAPPQMMTGLVLVSDGSGRGHEAHVFIVSCGKEVPPRSFSNVQRGESLACSNSSYLSALNSYPKTGL